MGFISFVEGPLLWAVFVTFITGAITRLIFFLYAILRSGKGKGDSFLYYTVSMILRALLPYQKGTLRKPAYTSIRYIFHICLFAVPIGLAGHVLLWEESRFGWNWPSLPDPLADWMTLLLLSIAAYLLLRRLLVSKIRKETSKQNYLLLITTALPFITGYLLAHGTLDSVPFLSDNMRAIHVLTGEAMLILATFLFYRTHLKVEKCTGCASCVVACPTQTLASQDREKFRKFSYLPYQCICCAACVDACPENAAELIHEIKPRRLFQLRFRDTIGSVALLVCKQCGTIYAPEPQVEKMSQKIHEDFMYLCPQCRMFNYGEKIRRATRNRRFPKDRYIA